MRFDLVDSVLERTDDRIVTLKLVTSAEEYLGDHFPSFPILPGVMMLESMVQAARRLLGDGSGGSGVSGGGGPWVVAEARNVKYGNMVRPGQALRVEVELKKADGDTRQFQGRGLVDGETAVAGRFTLRPVRR